MPKDEILAANVETRLTELKGKSVEEIATGSSAVQSLLMPQGVQQHRSHGLANVQNDVVAAVMKLSLDCDQKAGDARIRASLQNAISAAARWQVELRRS